MKARMFSAYGLVAAMSAKCEELPIGKKRLWTPDKKQQAAAISLYRRLVPQQSKFGELFPSGCVVADNAIELSSTMHVNLLWSSEASRCSLKHGSGVELAKDFKVYNGNTVVITTKTGTLLWISQGVPTTDNAFALHDHCLSVMQKCKSAQRGYTKVRFPQIHKGCSINFSSLRGMVVTGIDEAYTVSSCKQNNHFSLDLKGVQAKSDTRIRLVKSVSKVFTIDGPFTAFLTTKELSEPYFTVAVN